VVLIVLKCLSESYIGEFVGLIVEVTFFGSFYWSDIVPFLLVNVILSLWPTYVSYSKLRAMCFFDSSLAFMLVLTYNWTP